MRYFLLKKHINDKGITLKISSKIGNITNRMARLVRQHAKLDKQLVKELAKLNNITEDEVSDIMSSYDFLVDQSQYGLSNFSNEEISRQEYLRYDK